MQRRLTASCLLALAAFAAERSVAPYRTVKPVLDAFAAQLPAALRNSDQARWSAWSRQEDRAIRARLEQGDLDSLVNLLLFGTSFTKQPRIAIQDLASASKTGVLRARVDDLVQGLRSPGTNERLLFLSKVVPADAGTFILKNLERVLKENARFAERIQQGNSRAEVFRDRGVSLDTTVLPNFGLEETLRDLKGRGLAREGSVTRVAVIGPGLDFADWDAGYDYYPQQTMQPFALYNSLMKLGLAKAGRLEITVFDISPRVLDHLRAARARAARGEGYVIQLPRGSARHWTPEALDFWRSFGDQVAAEAAPIQPPELLGGLETRAVRVRPDVVLACQPADLNIVLERANVPAGQRFDLVVATNMFVYYDAFEKALARENVSSMLKPGGYLLSNDKLPEGLESSLRSAGSTTVWYSEQPKAGDAVMWYRKSPN